MDRTSEESVDWREYDHGEQTFRRKPLSRGAAADRDGDPDLGCSLYEIPPGKRSWPYHYHTGNAEAVYVLSGSGYVRTASDGGGNEAGEQGDEGRGNEEGEHGEEIDREPVEAGDYLAFPPDATGGHQLGNDGDEPLRVLVVSEMNEPDVTVYPEMNKVGVYAGSPPGGRSGREVEGYWHLDDTVEYWEE